MMARASAGAGSSPSLEPCLDILLTEVVQNGKVNGSSNYLAKATIKGTTGQDAIKSLSRRQLKQFLNVRTGIEKKLSSCSRHKVVEKLFNIKHIKEPSSLVAQQFFIQVPKPVSRRLRKGRHPLQLPALISSSSSNGVKPQAPQVCNNSACRAKLDTGDSFCRRCSCCICHKFDDNKDPSLWIECSTEVVNGRGGCGLSCHMECALNAKLAGVVSHGGVMQLDGSYSCLSCGMTSGLFGCWRKQLFVARDARRIDVLCHRLCLAHRLFDGTKNYKELHNIVVEAAQKLETEIGPVSKASGTLVRGIVNRLSTGAQVQKLIEEVLEKSKNWKLVPETEKVIPAHGRSLEGIYSLEFEDVSSEYIMVLWKRTQKELIHNVIGYKLWHRKERDGMFPKNPMYVTSNMDDRVLVTGLEAATEYVFRLVAFSTVSDIGCLEARCCTRYLRSLDEVGDSILEGNMENGLSITTLDALIRDADNLNSTFKIRNLPDTLPSWRSTCSSDKAFAQTADGAVKPSNSAEAASSALPVDTGVYFPEAKSQVNNGKIAVEVLLKLPSWEGNIGHDEKNMQCGSADWEENNHMQVMKDKESDDVGSDSPSSNCRMGVNYGGDKLQQSEAQLQLILHSKTGIGQVQPRSKSKKRTGSKGGQCFQDFMLAWPQGKFAKTDDHIEDSFEFCVKIVLWLERQGHLGSSFRLKFLTWLGIRASDKEKGIVIVYIKTMIDDPVALACQLVDTFEEIISIRRSKVK